MATKNAPGLGSVFFSKTKKAYVAQVLIGYDDKGRPKYRQAQRKKQADAAKELLRLQANIGIVAAGPSQKLGEYLDIWLENTVKPHAEPKTYLYYEYNVRMHITPELGHVVITKLTSQQIQALINKKMKTPLSPRTKPKDETSVKKKARKVEKPAETPAKPKPVQFLSARSVQAIRATLRAALALAWKQGLIRENPALRVSVPKLPQTEATYLTAEEVGKFVKKTDKSPLGRLYCLALLTGLRLGEATGLTWQDIDLDNSVIRVRRQLQRIEGVLTLKDLKSRSSRRVLALPDSAARILREQRDAQLDWKRQNETWPDQYNLVFTTIEGRPLDAKTVHNTLKRICRLAEIPEVSFHKLRHTTATHMAAAGVPLHIVKDQLGHSQIGLTSNTYAHAVPTALREASAILERSLNSAPPKEEEPVEEAEIILLPAAG